MIFNLITGILLTVYALLIAAITLGWWQLKLFKGSDQLPEIKVSVIVAARNEAGNIENLLNSLSVQQYPSQLLQIIIVDDHSTDLTSQLVSEFIALKNELHTLKLITLAANDSSGKKAAIEKGIQESDGDLIVITDADCLTGPLWISTIASYYAKHKPQMILGPVRMTHDGKVSGKLQSLEFTSLISSAAGSCNAGFPILANGANIAFTRHAYESCGRFSGNIQYPSGDDMFLMINIKRLFGARSIRFLKSEDAVVNTPATLGFISFIQQRLRWVSKSRGYTDPMLIVSSILVFFTNSWLVFIGFAAIVSREYLPVFILTYTIKMLIDLPLMLSYSRFQRSISLMWLFPVMELLNAVYTLLVGIAGNIGRYEWKGRKVSSKGIERG